MSEDDAKDKADPAKKKTVKVKVAPVAEDPRESAFVPVQSVVGELAGLAVPGVFLPDKKGVMWPQRSLAPGTFRKVVAGPGGKLPRLPEGSVGG